MTAAVDFEKLNAEIDAKYAADKQTLVQAEQIVRRLGLGGLPSTALHNITDIHGQDHPVVYPATDVPAGEAHHVVPPRPAPATGSVRATVLAFIANDYAPIPRIAESCKLGVEQVRGVLNAKDVRDRLVKRKVEGIKHVEYKLRGEGE